MALTWGAVDLVRGSMTVERSLEQTRAGLSFKQPKTRSGRRHVSLPVIALEALKAHRVRQLEMRMRLGLGKPDDDALVFTTPDGQPMPPNNLSSGLGDIREGAQAAGGQLSFVETQPCLAVDFEQARPGQRCSSHRSRQREHDNANLRAHVERKRRPCGERDRRSARKRVTCRRDRRHGNGDDAGGVFGSFGTRMGPKAEATTAGVG